MVLNTQNVEIVILAAGKGSRFGGIKQLAIFENKTLLAGVLETALSINMPVNIVLGAHGSVIINEIEIPKTVNVILNKNWTEGLSSSIKIAVDLLKNSKAILFLLADQVLIKQVHIKQLLDLHFQNPNKIIASQYHQILGVPMVVPTLYFNDLLQIEGDTGAKQLLQKNVHNVISIILPQAAFDIDTQQDLESLQ